MIKKILLILIVTFLACGLWAKTLEREANELGVDAETKYNAKNYAEAGTVFESAIAKYKEAVKTDGIPMDEEKVGRWLELAFNAYFNGKSYDNAIRILNVRAERNPDDYKIVKYQAIIYKKNLKQIDKAIEVMKNYNSRGDGSKRSFKVESKIASYYLSDKDYENSLIWYNMAYELKQDSKTIKNIATLNLKLNRKADAVKAYEDFILTNPKEAVLVKTYKNMAGLYEDMNDQVNAIKYFEKSNKIKFDKTITLLLISKYYDLKQYTNANSKITLLLGKDSGNSDAIYFRAMIKYDTGDKAGAKEDFQKISSDLKYSSAAKGFIESIESE